MPLFPLNFNKYKTVLSFLIVINFIVFTPGCSKPAAPQQNEKSWNQAYFGFNAKGLMNTSQQTQYANNFFGRVDNWIKSNLAVRVTGGTSSQITFGNNWTNEAINYWVALQKQHNLRFIYVVNGNDTPANQSNLIQRWIGAGARFDFLEMMNEYYLPKFANGDTGFEEVTRMVTPEIYAKEILPDFWATLDHFNLPYYIIFAPNRPNQPLAQQKMDHWNKIMVDSVITIFPHRNIHATIHLYDSGEALSNFDYNQIDSLRAKLPAGRHIAITEAGIVNENLTIQQVGTKAVEHYNNLLPHLRPGDYLLDQVLYNDGANNNTANLSPVYQGTTPKGNQLLEFINNRFR